MVARTLDGGATWELVSTTGRADGIAAAGSNVVYTPGNRYSTDGGTTWSPATGITVFGRDIVGDPSGRFIEVGNNGSIHRSTDGGASWSVVSSPTTATLWAVAGSGPYVAGGGGALIVSNAAGTSFSAVTPPTSVSIRAWPATVPAPFVAGGGNTIIYSTDSGASLVDGLRSPGARACSASPTPGGSTFVAVGNSGRVGPLNRRRRHVGLLLDRAVRVRGRRRRPRRAPDGGGAVREHDRDRRPPPATAVPPGPSPSTRRGRSEPSATTGPRPSVATGYGGFLTSTDRGETWISTVTGSGTGIDHNPGAFVAIAYNRATRSTDGGLTWSTVIVDSSSGQTYFDVAGDGATTFIGCGRNGRWVRSTDNGLTWQRLTISGATFLYGIATNRTGTWLTVGATSYRSTDGPTTWAPITVPGSPRDVAMGGTTAVAAGLTGLARSTDDGVTWSLVGPAGSTGASPPTATACGSPAAVGDRAALRRRRRDLGGGAQRHHRDPLRGGPDDRAVTPAWPADRPQVSRRGRGPGRWRAWPARPAAASSPGRCGTGARPPG